MTYLNPEDENAFLDMEKKQNPTKVRGGDFVECPKCHGFGGWNLILNAYGEGKHFKSNCQNCNGWGWVRADSTDATCLHEYVEISPEESEKRGIHHYGMFCHVSKCNKCDKTIVVDSSG